MKRRGTITIDSVVVSAHHIWFVREELRHYRKRKRELGVCEDDLVRATNPYAEPDMPRAPGPGNPTPNKSLALSKDEKRAALKEFVDWIDETFRDMDDRTKDVLNLLIVDGHYTASGVALTLTERDKDNPISERTVYAEMYRGLLALAIRYFGEERVILRGKLPKRKKVAVSGGSIEVK